MFRGPKIEGKMAFRVVLLEEDSGLQNLSNLTLFLHLQGGSLQNFLDKFVTFFVTLGLKILRLFSLKVLFEADIIKG